MELTRFTGNFGSFLLWANFQLIQIFLLDNEHVAKAYTAHFSEQCVMAQTKLKPTFPDLCLGQSVTKSSFGFSISEEKEIRKEE